MTRANGKKATYFKLIKYQLYISEILIIIVPIKAENREADSTPNFIWFSNATVSKAIKPIKRLKVKPIPHKHATPKNCNFVQS